MRVTFCGVRGSMPAPGAQFELYGGHTSCVAVARDAEPPSLVLDAGTGLVNVTQLLDGRPFAGSILIGHLHWDHTQGMPFFAGGTAAGSRVDVYLPEQGESAESVLERSFSPPHFPIVPRQLGPGWTFAGLGEGRRELEGFSVLARDVPHKGGRTFGYRVELDGASLAYISDHSPTSVGPGPDGLGARHQAIRELVEGVDLLITDAQHLQEEFPEVGFLGHASVEYDVALARESGVGTLALFHHDPRRTDDAVDAMLDRARALAGDGLQVVAASQGLSVDLLPGPRRAAHDER